MIGRNKWESRSAGARLSLAPEPIGGEADPPDPYAPNRTHLRVASNGGDDTSQIVRSGVQIVANSVLQMTAQLVK